MDGRFHERSIHGGVRNTVFPYVRELFFFSKKKGKKSKHEAWEKIEPNGGEVSTRPVRVVVGCMVIPSTHLPFNVRRVYSPQLTVCIWLWWYFNDKNLHILEWSTRSAEWLVTPPSDPDDRGTGRLKHWSRVPFFVNEWMNHRKFRKWLSLTRIHLQNAARGCDRDRCSGGPFHLHRVSFSVLSVTHPPTPDNNSPKESLTIHFLSFPMKRMKERYHCPPYHAIPALIEQLIVHIIGNFSFLPFPTHWYNPISIEINLLGGNSACSWLITIPTIPQYFFFLCRLIYQNSSCLGRRSRWMHTLSFAVSLAPFTYLLYGAFGTYVGTPPFPWAAVVISNSVCLGGRGCLPKEGKEGRRRTGSKKDEKRRQGENTSYDRIRKFNNQFLDCTEWWWTRTVK